MTEDMRTARDLVTEGHNLGTDLRYWRGTNYSGGNWTLADAPEPGDRASMSDFALEPHPWFGDAEPVEYVDLSRFTGWGDYSGAVYDRSNARSLVRDFPDTFVELYGDYSSEALALRADQEIPAHLFDCLVGLADNYPVYDESDMSELELELFNEDLDAWIISDVRSEVDTSKGDASEDDDDDDDAVRAAILAYCEAEGVWPDAETAVSVRFDVAACAAWIVAQS